MNPPGAAVELSRAELESFLRKLRWALLGAGSAEEAKPHPVPREFLDPALDLIRAAADRDPAAYRAWIHSAGDRGGTAPT